MFHILLSLLSYDNACLAVKLLFQKESCEGEEMAEFVIFPRKQQQDAPNSMLSCPASRIGIRKLLKLNLRLL